MTLSSFARTSLLAALLAAPAAAGAQAGPWTDKPVHPNPANEGPSEVADLDGDGDLDLLSSGQLVINGQSTLSWHENGACDAWTRHLIDVLPVGIGDPTAADLDGDGDLDVVLGADLILGQGGWVVRWYENTAGDASAWTSTDIGPIGILRRISEADVDGDGDTDFFLSQIVPDRIDWYENLAGDGSSWLARNVQVGKSGTGMSAADVDGDGDADLLCGFEGNDSEVTWFENVVGDGSAWLEHLIEPSLDRPVFVTGEDVDGDGDLDVVFCDREFDLVDWYENVSGDGSTWTRHVITSLELPGTVFVEDVDGDGDLDVIPTASSLTQIDWYENTAGDGSVWAQQSLFTPTAVVAVATADLGADGDLDVFSYQLSTMALQLHESVGALEACPSTISLGAGGSQALGLNADLAQGFKLYFLLTTTAGTSPGLPLPPSPLVLPLNFSSLLLFTATSPNLLIPGSFGVLDTQGEAATSLTLPPGLDPALAGVTLHHAFLALDPPAFTAAFVSNPVATALVP